MQLRINGISLIDFRTIGTVELLFPSPTMRSDADVFAIASRNGGGKTSVLDACAIMAAMNIHSGERSISRRHWSDAKRLHDILSDASNQPTPWIPSGPMAAALDIDEVGYISHVRSDSLFYSGSGRITSNFSIESAGAGISLESYLGSMSIGSSAEYCLRSGAAGPVASPRAALGMCARINTISPDVIYLNACGGFDGDLCLNTIGAASAIRDVSPLAASNDEMFLGSSVSREVYDRFLGSLSKYVKNIKAKPSRGTVMHVADLAGSKYFSYGQRVMISTLMLVSLFSEFSPLILIDCPETGIGPEWQRTIVGSVHDCSPGSQIIVATHSEDVWDSVPERNRIMLSD